MSLNKFSALSLRFFPKYSLKQFISSLAVTERCAVRCVRRERMCSPRRLQDSSENLHAVFLTHTFYTNVIIYIHFSIEYLSQ